MGADKWFPADITLSDSLVHSEDGLEIGGLTLN